MHLKRIFLLKMFLVLACSSESTFGQSSCFNPQTKKCPKSGSRLLDDTYPPSAFVISTQPQKSSRNSEQLPTRFIFNVLDSYDFTNTPPIYVPTTRERFDQLLSKLRTELAGKPNAEQLLSKVIFVSSEEYTWQQDHFESFYNPTTGKPVLRSIESYDKIADRDMGKKIAQAGNACGVQAGPTLKEDEVIGSPAGQMGGNIEGLPGGLCLVGDNISTDFVSQFCGNKDNHLHVDVSWLLTQHVDEIYKVVPGNKPGVPPECNFSLMVASPRKAIELLGDAHSLTHELFDPALFGETKDSRQEALLNRTQEGGAHGVELCNIYKNHIQPLLPQPNKGASPAGGGALNVFYQKVTSSFLAIASDSFNNCQLDKVTNGQFLEGFKKSTSYDYSLAVQKQIDKDTERIRNKILARLPHCREHFNTIEVPNLFFGMRTDDDGNPLAYDQKSEKFNIQGGSSFFPNPTNSVLANDRLIFSDPQNPRFKDYLTQEMTKIGLESRFIDTWDYAHTSGGNLHCSSHSLLSCTP